MQEKIEGIILDQFCEGIGSETPPRDWIVDAAAEITKLFRRTMADIDILLVIVIVLFAGLVVEGCVLAIALMALATVRGG